MINKITKFEKVNFGKEVEVRRYKSIDIKEEDIPAIIKVIPLSLKNTTLYNKSNGTLLCSSKKLNLGHNSIEIFRKGNYLIGWKEYSNNNNRDFLIASIVKESE